MSGLKPSNVKRMQKEGKNPMIDSSADGEPKVNALGRKYKISRISFPGRKYYEQPNGSWSWNVPKASVKPGSAEVLAGNARAESPGPANEAPANEAPAQNGKDPLSRPSRESPPAAPPKKNANSRKRRRSSRKHRRSSRKRS